MTHFTVLVSVGTNNLEKLGILGIIVLFSGAVYAIMSRVLDKKLREYHESLEREQEDDRIGSKTEEQNQGECR